MLRGRRKEHALLNQVITYKRPKTVEALVGGVRKKYQSIPRDAFPYPSSTYYTVEKDNFRGSLIYCTAFMKNETAIIAGTNTFDPAHLALLLTPDNLLAWEDFVATEIFNKKSNKKDGDNKFVDYDREALNTCIGDLHRTPVVMSSDGTAVPQPQDEADVDFSFQGWQPHTREDVLH